MKWYLSLIAKVIYVVLCSYILANTLYHFDETHEGQHYIIGMVIAMTVLTFPCGLIVMLIEYLFLYLISILLTNFAPSFVPATGVYSERARAIWLTIIILVWFGMFATGYYQWFRFVPRRLANKRRGKSENKIL